MTISITNPTCCALTRELLVTIKTIQGCLVAGHSCPAATGRSLCRFEGTVQRVQGMLSVQAVDAQTYSSVIRTFAKRSEMREVWFCWCSRVLQALHDSATGNWIVCIHLLYCAFQEVLAWLTEVWYSTPTVVIQSTEDSEISLGPRPGLPTSLLTPMFMQQSGRLSSCAQWTDHRKGDSVRSKSRWLQMLCAGMSQPQRLGVRSLWGGHGKFLLMFLQFYIYILYLFWVFSIDFWQQWKLKTYISKVTTRGGSGHDRYTDDIRWYTTFFSTWRFLSCGITIRHVAFVCSIR